MADQNSKQKPMLPSWQRVQSSDDKPKSSEAALSQPSAENDDKDTSTPPSKMTLLEQAQKFLEDEKIENAPRERKVAFLEKKGLQSDDIQKLLGPSESTDSTTETQSELKTVHDSNESSTAKQVESQPNVQTVPTQQSPSASPSLPSPMAQRDAAPIITYPEFLLKPQKPPPLVTIERIINAAYALAGISAITYGTSKYLVQPMLESLTEARHELAEQAKSDLSKLNHKLEHSVSHVPYIPSSAVLDTESIDSDPTELFHRDIATQTSPEPTSSPADDLIQSDAKDPSIHQSSRLNSLQATLSSLLQSVETSTPAESRLRQTSSDFQAVLDKIESNQYQSAFTSSGTGGVKYGYVDSNNNTAAGSQSPSYLYGGTGGTRKPSSVETGNEAAKFKAEIRALKGVFLSSRNFPTAKPLAAASSSSATAGSR